MEPEEVDVSVDSEEVDIEIEVDEASVLASNKLSLVCPFLSLSFSFLFYTSGCHPFWLCLSRLIFIFWVCWVEEHMGKSCKCVKLAQGLFMQ